MDERTARKADIHQTLAYSGRKMNWKFLGLGVLLLGLGGVLAYVQPSSFDTKDRFILVLTLVLGVGLTLYALARLLVPGKARLTLSPAGLRLPIEWVKDVVIPWREVKGIDTIDISGTVRGTLITFSGVTVVQVSRAFYDRHIHVNSWLLRGPGWDFNFIPKGSLVQVALHHEALPATAAELRSAVETRWHAFRDVPSAAASVPQTGQRNS